VKKLVLERLSLYWQKLLTFWAYSFGKTVIDRCINW